MREKPPEEPGEDIPFWFVTYSDVITLLMTFFILLLTFATTEPESFEQVQISFFGGGGATGLAGPPQDPMAKDAFVVRVRPPAGRQSTRGSEMPPTHSDPALEAMSSGIESLNDENRRDLQQRYAFRMPLSLLVDNRGRITGLGHQRVRMLVMQLNKAPFNASIMVANQEDLTKVMSLSDELTHVHKVALGKVSVGMTEAVAAGAVEIVLSWDQG